MRFFYSFVDVGSTTREILPTSTIHM